MRLAKSFIEVDTDSREPAATTIKAYMPVGSMSGSGSIDVTAFEALIPSKELVFHGVRFEVNSGEEYSPLGIATVSIENAEKLLSSIDHLAGVKITTDRFALSEIEAVVEELRIVVFNTQQGRLHAAVEAGGTTCHLMRQSDLIDLGKLVSLAIAHLRDKGAKV